MDDTFSTKEGRIRERAFAIWEAAGKPEGQADLHWFQAAAEINAEPESLEIGEVVAKRRRSTTAVTPPDPAGDQQKDPVPLVAPSDSEGG